MQDGLGEGHRGEFHRGPSDPRVPGNDGFLAQVQQSLANVVREAPSLDAVVDTVCEAYHLDESARWAPTKGVRSASRGWVAGLSGTFRNAHGGWPTFQSERRRQELGSMATEGTDARFPRMGRAPQSPAS